MTILSVTPPSVEPGAKLTATWGGIPYPTPGDWIGLYPAGASNEEPTDWKFVGGYQTLGIALAAGSLTFTAPKTPGNYELRLLRDRGYVDIAQAPLTVTAPEVLRMP